MIIPLAAVARPVADEGASRISREINERRVAVRCSVRGRDQGSFVVEAQRRVNAAVQLPPGYHLTWGGQFENQRRATARLAVIVRASYSSSFCFSQPSARSSMRPSCSRIFRSRSLEAYSYSGSAE